MRGDRRWWWIVYAVGAGAVIAALVIHTVFSFEQVTVGSLFSFLGFKLSTATAGLTAWTTGASPMMLARTSGRVRSRSSTQ